MWVFKIENTCSTDIDLMGFDYYVITQKNSQTLVSISSFGKDKTFLLCAQSRTAILGKGKSRRHLGKQDAQNKTDRTHTSLVFNHFRTKT